MNVPSLLVFVRHAESDRNRAKAGGLYFPDDAARAAVRGVPDHKVGITPAGVTQAERTGRYLWERFGAFDAAYHSGYARTTRTLDGIRAAHPGPGQQDLPTRADLLIRERDPGYTYEMTTAEAEAAFPWLESYWRTVGGFFAQPPGGESLAQVTQRVRAFLDRLFRDEAGRRVLVVTHAGTLRCFRVALEGWDYDRAGAWPPGQSPENCGVTVYEHDVRTGGMALREYNTVCWR